MDKLKPCPFCGNEDITITEIDGLYQAVCSVMLKGCGAATGYQYSIDKAIKEWNRRAGKTAKTRILQNALQNVLFIRPLNSKRKAIKGAENALNRSLKLSNRL